MITPKYLAAASAMDGFKNYLSSSFSTTISGQTLGAGAFVSATASTPLNNSNSISQVQMNLGGLESSWNVLCGTFNNYYATGTYEIEAMYYFDATNLNVLVVVVNQSGGNVTIPTITVNCRGFLFLAPF